MKYKRAFILLLFVLLSAPVVPVYSATPEVYPMSITKYGYTLEVSKLAANFFPDINTDIGFTITVTFPSNASGADLFVGLLPDSVSNHLGQCISHDDNGEHANPDLMLRLMNNDGWRRVSGSRTTLVSHLIATGTLPVPSSVNVYCKDSAASGKIVISLDPTGKPAISLTRRIPFDDANENGIADGWAGDAIKNYTGGEDEETGPAGTNFLGYVLDANGNIEYNNVGIPKTKRYNVAANGHVGDGLTAFEEYRGAKLARGLPVKRFDPTVKDIFVTHRYHNNNDLKQKGTGTGADFKLTPYEIITARTDNVVNLYTDGRAASRVFAIKIEENTTQAPANLQVPPLGEATGNANIPKCTDVANGFYEFPPEVTIYTARLTADEMGKVLSHEIGHCVNLEHCDQAEPGCLMFHAEKKLRISFGKYHIPEYDLIEPFAAVPVANPIIGGDNPGDGNGDSGDDSNILSTNTGYSSSHGCDYNSEHDYCSDTGTCGSQTSFDGIGLCGHRWCLCPADDSSSILSTNTGVSDTYGCHYISERDYCSDTGTCGSQTSSDGIGLCGHRYCLCPATDDSSTDDSSSILSTNTGVSDTYGCHYISERDYCSDTGTCGSQTSSDGIGLCGHRYCLCPAAD